MKVLLRKPSTFSRIEFWAVTTLFLFILFFFVTDAINGIGSHFDTVYKRRFDEVRLPFHFYENYFIPQLFRQIAIYVTLVLLNFIIIPRLVKNNFLWRNVLSLLFVFLALVLVFGITGSYLRSDLYASLGKEKAEENILQDAFGDAFTLLLVFGIYTALKYASIYLLTISQTIEAKYRFIRREAIVATFLWMVGMLSLIAGNAEYEILAGWAIVVPSAILLYLACFYRLIPISLVLNSHQFFFYVLKVSGLLAPGFFIIFLLLLVTIDEGDPAAVISFFNCLFQLCITAPVTWALYKKRLRQDEEIAGLQKELKRSGASIDFLRSQINPHFLFNALNTLYGTAIEENAERTGDGIQQLGDMMRFMLQENMQDSVSLTREINYLKNYISLQRLRTDTNPDIQIQTQIRDQHDDFQIAPMLLIPFVENAFKHGISFREPSQIKVTLAVKNCTLHFEVYNSQHIKTGIDLERDKTGVGLENVKQRLELIYPDKHELIIQETTKGYFVHLSIQLVKTPDTV